MKVSKIVLGMVAALGMNAALAADGTITIEGKVVDTTCSVVAGGENKTVTLPNVAKSSLANNNDVAGKTQFTLSLNGCAGQNVAAYFEQNANVAANGNLTTGVNNVQVQLLDKNNAAINISQPQSTQINAYETADATSGEATLTYYAQYFATGAAEAGTVNTTVNYTIAYQ